MMPVVWNLTVEQANYILSVLGKQPFVEVQPLISELIKQSHTAPTAPTDAAV